MKKGFVFGGLVLVVSVFAFAGKLERDKKAELEPRVKAATEAFKKNCGCGVAITVKWDNYKKADDMGQIGWAMDSIKDGSESYCKDAGGKKAMCNMKSIEYSFGSTDEQPKFAAGLVSAQSNAQGYVTWDQITKVVDQ